MPIEFNCTECGSLLRTPDNTAGQQAKCPQCGAVVGIPPASAPSVGPLLPVPPERIADFPEDPENPYRSPVMSDLPSFPQGYAPSPFAAERTGPPWEREGKSIKSFFSTVKLLFTALTFFFSNMRREGGLGAPLLFGLLGGMIGATFNLLLQFGLQGALMFVTGNFNRGLGPGEGLLIFGIFAAIGIIVMPIFLILGMFFNAAITHLMLLLLGGARFPFETTFRVVAYCAGGTSILLLIPFCGQYAQGIVQIVFTIFGIWKAHEISGGKATAAVLLPIGLCVLAVVGIIVAVIVAAVAAS